MTPSTEPGNTVFIRFHLAVPEQDNLYPLPGGDAPVQSDLLVIARGHERLVSSRWREKTPNHLAPLLPQSEPKTRRASMNDWRTSLTCSGGPSDLPAQSRINSCIALHPQFWWLGT